MPGPFAVVGSGFGLYGYLPALRAECGGPVLLEERYREKAQARPELASALKGVKWAKTLDEALASAGGVALASTPTQQVELVARCLKYPGITTYLLEKPLAPSPKAAGELLASLKGKKVRVGYTFLSAGWRSQFENAVKSASEVSIRWTFQANHFAKNLDTWKRRDAEGGGALNFFGIQALALLATAGYDAVESSERSGEKPGETESWRAIFRGKDLPSCRLLVHSRCAKDEFSISAGSNELIALGDPFEGEHGAPGDDRRVSLLRRHLATLNEPDEPWLALYAATNSLWARCL